MSGSLIGLDNCFAHLSKSPLMALILLPVGPLHGNPGSLGLASVVLALMVFGVAISLAQIATRLRIPVWAIGLACVAILMTPSVANAEAPLLADGILALVIACTMLMPILEVQKEAEGTTWGGGALWGLLFALGASLKLSYLTFAVLAFPLAGILSLRRVGLKATAIKVLAAAIVASPVLLALARYGKLYLQHAQNFSFGSLAEYYADGIPRWTYLSHQLTEAPVAILVAILLAGIAAWRWRQDPARVATGFAVAGIVILFDVIAAGSPNKDPRFFWPVWVGLPICLAAAVPPVSNLSRLPRSAAAVGWAMTVAILLALPMYSRMDLQAVMKAQAALEVAKQRGVKTFAIAADTASINVETFVLASRLNSGRFADMTIFTVVYDIMQGKDAGTSLARLTSADVAAFFQPDGSAPEWANRNFSVFAHGLASEQREVISPPSVAPIQLSFPKS